jgi:hypothetical protein
MAKPETSFLLLDEKPVHWEKQNSEHSHWLRPGRFKRRQNAAFCGLDTPLGGWASRTPLLVSAGRAQFLKWRNTRNTNGLMAQ